MIQETIRRLVDRQDLSEEETVAVFTEIMSGRATPIQIAVLITALRMKGETIAEITGAARVMRAKMIRVRPRAEVVLDTCGTGGSGSGVFNVSTVAAFVIAGCGVTVAKHGNRSVSSKCGSADVLESLGLDLTASPEEAERCLNKVGIAFLFAPVYHSAMKFAAAPRKESGIRTIFNILGPLANPALANVQVLGVYAPSLVEPLARVLANLGVRRAYVVCGEGGLDEISTAGPTEIVEVADGEMRHTRLEPPFFGITKASLSALRGADVSENARILHDVLDGAQGPHRDIVLVNAAAGLVVAGKVRGIEEGIEKAAASIDSGKAREKLSELLSFMKGGRE